MTIAHNNSADPDGHTLSHLRSLPRCLNANCELTGYKPATLEQLKRANELWRKA